MKTKMKYIRIIWIEFQANFLPKLSFFFAGFPSQGRTKYGFSN